MSVPSRAVDAYIAKAPAYARPILEKIRRHFHRASPDIEETIKWGVPHFEYQGIVAGMAAFKSYVRFGFWKGVGPTMSATKLTDVSQLPPDKVLLAWIKHAIELNEQDIKPTKPTRAPRRKTLKVPPDLATALRKNKKALAAFEGFSPSHRREYIEWLADAKQEATRHKRLATAIEWIAEGKPRNWKYMREYR